jgi:hypothetical protein
MLDQELDQASFNRRWGGGWRVLLPVEGKLLAIISWYHVCHAILHPPACLMNSVPNIRHKNIN